MRPRISIWGSVRPSVGPSVRRSVGDAFVKNKENHYFRANNCSRRYTRRISCNHIIIQSFNHHISEKCRIFDIVTELSRVYPLMDHRLIWRFYNRSRSTRSKTALIRPHVGLGGQIYKKSDFLDLGIFQQTLLKLAIRTYSNQWGSMSWSWPCHRPTMRICE